MYCTYLSRVLYKFREPEFSLFTSDLIKKGNVISILQGENQLVLISELSLMHRGKAYTWRRANHYHFYRNQVIDAWLYESDQYLANEAFG